MANANQFKTSWDAFDKIFDEAFSRTKQTTHHPPYFSPTPFTPYPPTEYGFESGLTPYPGDLGKNIGHDEVEEQDFNAQTHDYHEDSDRDESYRFHYDDVYSRADMDYYEDDDYEKELWTKRARKAQAVGQGNSGVQKTDALRLTGVAATGFGSGNAGTNAMGLNVGSSAFSQRPQSNTVPQTTSKPRPTINTNLNPVVSTANNNNNNIGTSSTSNPLANAMNAFSTAAATLNGLTNTLNNLGLGIAGNTSSSNVYPSSSAPSAQPRVTAPTVSQVPTIAQPRPPIRKPPPPLNLDDSSSGSGSASSSSLDPTSPFKLSPGPSPPAPSAPPATAQYQAEFYPQHQGQFQFQQYQFQPDNHIPTSRSMFLQQRQQQQQHHTQTRPKSPQGHSLAGQKQGPEQGKTQEAVSTQVRSQTQPIPVPAISKASTQAALQESQSRSFERNTGGISLVSPSPRLKASTTLSTSPNVDSVDYSKSPAPSNSTVNKKRRPNPGKVTFRNTPDGTRTTAMFDMQGIKKSDVHVSYQNDKVVVSWESVTVEDKMEDGKIVRERREKKFVRTLPLPEGTKFDQVKASMDGRHLNLTYPRFRS